MNKKVINSHADNTLGSIMTSLQTDILGRISRLPIEPSEASTLLPMFEAISNGLHAIEDRFAQDSQKSGKIIITILRDDSDKDRPVLGYKIEDNGVGLNEQNFQSFCKPDSLYKVKRGGKGVGRLGWLKIFHDICVDSKFVDIDKQIKPRSFLFKLANQDQIKENETLQNDINGTGTIVTLKNFESRFKAKCPNTTTIIQERIIAHFLPLFATRQTPEITFIDNGEKTNLQFVFNDLIKDVSEENINVRLNDEDVSFHIHHVKMNKKFKPSLRAKNHNWLFMAANSRVAYEKPLDNYLGLQLLENNQIYIGCTFSEYLDKKVNQERTGFNCSREEIDEIVRTLSSSIKNYLQKDINIIKEKKKKLTINLINEHPIFFYIKDNLEEFVNNLPPNAQKKDIFSALSTDRYEKTNEFNKEKDNLQRSDVLSDEIKERVEKLNNFIQKNGQGILAEYILTRTAIIDILDHYLEITDKDKYEKEEVIHNLIVPMQTDSTSLTITDHNLWILDDRLPFFGFFASDKRLNQYTDIASNKRPDIAFFYDTCLAWSEGDNNNKVVLVEFKRPSRDDYTSSDNPIQQLIDYIRDLKQGCLKDNKGKALPQTLKNASFHCYLIADLGISLERCLDGRGFVDTPDGKGKIGFFTDLNAVVEIIPYDKLISDAKKRNAIFLQKLGITN